MSAFVLPVLPVRLAHNRVQITRKNACGAPKRRVEMRLPVCETLEKTTRDWGLTIDSSDDYGNGITALSRDPPLLRIERFLTDEQCDALISAQESKTQECDLYLNYRVNQEVASGVSHEAAELIESSGARGISATSRSGFRAQIDPTEAALQPVLHGIRRLLGFGDREFVFEEGAWVRPNRRRVVVRDQTTVRYEVGEGVAPHVDGKDVTVLICLEEPLSGGRTVFPDDGIAVAPKKGCALVYRSCAELVHFAEAVGEGRKWVLQLLVDFRVRSDEMDVDFSSGAVYSS